MLKILRILLLPAILLHALPVISSDSIPPRTVYSISGIYMKTTRFYDTHVHNRYSPLDFRTDDQTRPGAAAVGVNMLRMLKPRWRMETGIFLSFYHYRAYQYNLVGFVNDPDTFYSYYYDEERVYKMNRLTVPLKVLYHLSPRTFPWYATSGITVSRMLFESMSGEVVSGKEVQKHDSYGNIITYHKYQLDYIGGIGKMIRLGPTLQFRIEGGYAGSMVSVLKKPDRGWLSAIYLQFGLISL